jgi:hypothetical protein
MNFTKNAVFTLSQTSRNFFEAFYTVVPDDRFIYAETRCSLPLNN